MTAPTPPPVDPGATPTAARAIAPDLARGGMLLLIALANVHVYVYGHSIGVRGYPRDVAGVDQVVALLQMLLVDGRAYPLFAFLFGYGIVQLTRRRGEVGIPAEAVTRLVRRRGGWMVLIGFLHGLLLWSGDIVGAYGMIAVLLAGLLVRGDSRTLLGTAVAGTIVTTLIYAATALPMPDDPQTFLPSMAVENPLEAAFIRVFEWTAIGFVMQVVGVFGAVALGAWAARRGLLDEPARHRRLLVGATVAGIGAAVLLGLPMALMTAEVWTAPPLATAAVAASLHTLGGYAGGVGYAALFGLVAIRLARRSGPVSAALQACGQRSLSCYLAQSVSFAALLPAWSLGLGDGAHLWQGALVGIGTWLVILLVAVASARVGYRGPAEVLLRRLTYGAMPTPSRTSPLSR